MAFIKIPNTYIAVNTDNITSLRKWWDEEKQESYTTISFIHHYDNLNVYYSAASFEEIVEECSNINKTTWKKIKRQSNNLRDIQK